MEIKFIFQKIFIIICLLFTESDIGPKESDDKNKNRDDVTNEETESQLLLQEHIFKVWNYESDSNTLELLSFYIKFIVFLIVGLSVNYPKICTSVYVCQY